MKNVFVTGATGFIGSHLVRMLSKGNAYNVVALVRDYRARSIFYGCTSSPEMVVGDVTDYRTVERAINEYEIDTIFHLAAQAIVKTANASPIGTFETNIKGAWNVLEASRVIKSVKKVVCASSDKAYGVCQDLPYTEETRLQGAFPYDVSKSCVDLLAQSYRASYGLPVTIVRSSNVYGGGDLNLNRIVPNTIRHILAGERPVIRGQGLMKRDYMHVIDAVKAYLYCVDYHGDEDAFNFGTETPTQLIDLVRMIAKEMGGDLEPICEIDAPCEIPDQWLSTKKARAILGWQPMISLADGLKDTIAWYRSFFAHEAHRAYAR